MITHIQHFVNAFSCLYTFSRVVLAVIPNFKFVREVSQTRTSPSDDSSSLFNICIISNRLDIGAFCRVRRPILAALSASLSSSRAFPPPPLVSVAVGLDSIVEAFVLDDATDAASFSSAPSFILWSPSEIIGGTGGDTFADTDETVRRPLST